MLLDVFGLVNIDLQYFVIPTNALAGSVILSYTLFTRHNTFVYYNSRLPFLLFSAGFAMSQ